LGGVGTLIFASGPERKHAVIKSLPDPLHREQASREALHLLARSGKTKRFIAAGLFSAVAVYALTASSDADGALVPGALAVYQLLSKSREENAYARFLAGGGTPPEGVNLGFGPGPRGGFRLVLTASF
jgi:di/tricarboxylate transporter